MTRKLPGTSRRPLPTPLAMSDALAEATPSSLPAGLPHRGPGDGSAGDYPDSERPQRPFPLPKLRVHVEDLMHKGAQRFFEQVQPQDILPYAVATVQQELYRRAMTKPSVRSITLFLDAFDGVAYTKGMDLDDEHKEIHFSLNYIAGIDDSTATRLRDEIRGVVVHEMVHVWQWNAKGTCPGGLIEGVADFVRLRAGLSPPHWRREKSDRWDAGYEKTGYFLDWLERTYGGGTVVKMNAALKDSKYDEMVYWTSLFNSSIEELWKRYQQQLDQD